MKESSKKLKDSHLTVFFLSIIVLPTIFRSLMPLVESATFHVLHKENSFDNRYGRLLLGGWIGFIVMEFVAVKLFYHGTESFFAPLSDMLQAGILINFFLAFFNLIPLPPLDGSRVITMFISYKKAAYLDMFAPYSFLLILLLWQVGVLNYIIATPALLLYKLSVTLSYNMFVGFM